MSNHDSYDTIGSMLKIHKMVSGFIIEAVEDVPESRMIEQPGTIVNHPAWTLSHLNAYAAVLLSMFDDPSAPTADVEMERFGYGTTPVPDATHYATKGELIERFKERNARIGELVAAKHAEYFPKPSPARFQPYSQTISDIAIVLIVAHPPHHLGQLKQWRRAAGMGNAG